MRVKTTLHTHIPTYQPYKVDGKMVVGGILKGLPLRCVHHHLLPARYRLGLRVETLEGDCEPTPPDLCI